MQKLYKVEADGSVRELALSIVGLTVVKAYRTIKGKGRKRTHKHTYASNVEAQAEIDETIQEKLADGYTKENPLEEKAPEPKAREDQLEAFEIIGGRVDGAGGLLLKCMGPTGNSFYATPKGSQASRILMAEKLPELVGQKAYILAPFTDKYGCPYAGVVEKIE